MITDVPDNIRVHKGAELTLEQANKWSELYDAIKNDKDLDEPAAVAWSEWEKLYEKKDDRWVKARKLDGTGPRSSESAESEAEAIADGMELSAESEAESVGELSSNGKYVGGLVWRAGPISMKVNGEPMEVWTDKADIPKLAKKLIAKAGKIGIGIEDSNGHHPGIGQRENIGQAKAFVYDAEAGEIYLKDSEIFDTPSNSNIIEMNRRGMLEGGFSWKGTSTLVRRGGKWWLKDWDVKREDIVSRNALGVPFTNDPNIIPAGLAEAERVEGSEHSGSPAEITESTESTESNEDETMTEQESHSEQIAVPSEAAQPDERVIKAEAEAELYRQKLERVEAEAEYQRTRQRVEGYVMKGLAEARLTPAMKDAFIELGMYCSTQMLNVPTEAEDPQPGPAAQPEVPASAGSATAPAQPAQAAPAAPTAAATQDAPLKESGITAVDETVAPAPPEAPAGQNGEALFQQALNAMPPQYKTDEKGLNPDQERLDAMAQQKAEELAAKRLGMSVEDYRNANTESMSVIPYQ